MPNTIIIGTQKSGTSALFHYLSSQDGVRVSNIKEVHYFDENFDKGLWWYRRHFPFVEKCAKVILEATPHYSFYEPAAQRIAGLLPKSKLILLLRNPVDRAYSHYQMAKSEGYETSGSFEEALARESQRLSMSNDSQQPSDQEIFRRDFSYVERGKYVEQVQRFLNHFDRRNLLVVDSDSLFRNPMKELVVVHGFLGIEAAKFPTFEKRNAGRYSPVRPDTYSRLSSYFRPYNEQLSELLNQEFDWNDR